MHHDPLMMETCKSLVYLALNSTSHFYVFFSFVSATTYVGFAEALRRIVYHHEISTLNRQNFLSNILLIYVSPVLMFCVICALFLVFRWIIQFSPESRISAAPGRMNYWLWNFVILLPVIIFSVKPEASSWLRVGRLATAIALGYLLLIAAIDWYHTMGWHAYNACQSHFRDGAVQEHPECKGLIPGGNLGFFLILGWIPVIGLVGGLELLWRIWHRRRTRNTDASFGEWASNILLVLSVPVWIYFAVLITGGIYSMMYPFQPSH